MVSTFQKHVTLKVSKMGIAWGGTLAWRVGSGSTPNSGWGGGVTTHLKALVTIPIIIALGRMRLGNYELQDRLNYIKDHLKK